MVHRGSVCLKTNKAGSCHEHTLWVSWWLNTGKVTDIILASDYR